MEFMIDKLLSFALVLTRLSAFFLVLPVFGFKSIPMRIKTATAILMSIFFVSVKPAFEASAGASTLEAGLFLCYETIYGFALGLIAAIMFSAVKVSGRIIERQMGMAMSQVMDPLSGDRAQPLGMLLEMIFILLFLSANGHHIFLLAISKSYDSFPVGSAPSLEILVGGVIQAGSTMLVASLRMAAPMLAAFIVLMVALAVLARIVPEMNILFISMPVRIGLGLIMIAIFLPFFGAYITEFSDWMGKLLPL